MIRSKAALIEALKADPTARLYCTLHQRAFIKGNNTNMQYVHGQAVDAATRTGVAFEERVGVTEVYKLPSQQVQAHSDALYLQQMGRIERDGKPHSEGFTVQDGTALATINQPGHVCPNTGRRAMTLAEAAQYKLQPGERMHIYSKARTLKKQDPWKRLYSVMHKAGAATANVCWANGGLCEMPADRIVYIGA